MATLAGQSQAPLLGHRELRSDVLGAANPMVPSLIPALAGERTSKEQVEWITTPTY